MYCDKCGAVNPDTAQFCSDCGERLRASYVAADRQKKKSNGIGIAVAIVIVVVAIIAGMDIYTKSPAFKYKNAEKLLECGEYQNAYDQFVALGNYKDAPDKAEKAIREIYPIIGNYELVYTRVDGEDFVEKYGVSGSLIVYSDFTYYINFVGLDYEETYIWYESQEDYSYLKSLDSVKAIYQAKNGHFAYALEAGHECVVFFVDVDDDIWYFTFVKK